MIDPVLTLYAYAMEDYRRVNEPFIDARRAYLTDPAADGGRHHTISGDGDGSIIRYQFRPSGFRWTVHSGKQELQRAVKEKTGGYAVQVRSTDGTIFRIDHFSPDHLLERVSYYAGSLLRGEVTLLPDGRVDTSFLITEENVYHREQLLPCPFIRYADEADYHRCTRALGVPPVIAYTTTGVVCYYPPEAAARAAQLAAEIPAEPSGENLSDTDDMISESVSAESAAVFAVPAGEIASNEPELSDNPGDVLNKRYYASGKIQSGKFISDLVGPESLFRDQSEPVPVTPVKIADSEQTKAADFNGNDVNVPSAGELYTELYNEHTEASCDRDSVHTAELYPEGGSGQLQYRADGRIDYAGELRNGERSGFGICADLTAHTAFAGTWLYNGRCGLELRVADGGTVYAQFTDTADESGETGSAAVFDSTGGLLYSGGMKQDIRCGFGTAQRPDGTHYVGQWKNDQPNGNGLLLSGAGELLYQGQWTGGIRCGQGTEYRDGQIRYNGQWKNDCYDGNGALTTAQGARVLAKFIDGEPDGAVCELDAQGQKRYVGEWKNGARNGSGMLFLPDGGTLDGSFDRGQLVGEVHERDAGGALIYSGSYADGERSGNGILYTNGQLVYEGEFAHGRRSGRGKCYADGELIYAGELQDDRRSGVGASLVQGKPDYFGEWVKDLPDGYGIQYTDGEPAFAGCFTAGQKNGRVNEYRNGQLLRELLYRTDTAEYMVEYNADGTPVYAGAVYEGQRSGLGRLLNEYCECEQQGIFKNGAFLRTAQVIPRRLDPLPCPDRLRGTPYEEAACPQDGYLLGLPTDGGIYSGAVRSGVPEGRGTIAYADHIYTGHFSDGKPQGEGRLYLSSGEIVTGLFGDAEGAEKLRCGTVVYTLCRSENPAESADRS